MRRVSTLLWVLSLVLTGGTRLRAEPFQLSRSPRELGPAALRELAIRETTISFRVDSNGCTDAASFRCRTERREGIGQQSPHDLITIERVGVDVCKAMLWDGVVIEVDLEKDLGLSGAGQLIDETAEGRLQTPARRDNRPRSDHALQG